MRRRQNAAAARASRLGSRRHYAATAHSFLSATAFFKAVFFLEGIFLSACTA
jgi:hypothetical protein